MSSNKKEGKYNIPSSKKFLRETDARILIDEQLKNAGWDIKDKNQVSTEVTSEHGRADYILKDRRGRAIAVVEAKRFSVDPTSAKDQALKYAEDSNIDFIFLSNGEDIYFWDYKYRPEQKVATFYSQRDLEKVQNLRQDQKPINQIPIPEKYFKGGEWRTLRPYQKEAMRVLDKAIEGKKRKLLVVMATGTGKTDTIALYLKRLFDSGMVNRALFLVDRIDLGIQAQAAFSEILKDQPCTLLYGGKPKDESSIVISTLQTLHSQLPQFTSGYFDVVISDEAHRTIFGVYNSVLSHFDSIRIGLTATPSTYINRNTYKLFGSWNEKDQKGEPTFVYGIRSGIKDGYLAGYGIVQIDTKISTKGIKFEGDDFSPSDLERKINVPARNEQIAKTYKVEEEKRESKRLRKGIVFAVTKKHAAQLAYYLNQEFPEYNGRFAEVITSDTEDASAAIRRFKLENLPALAVSVDMLSTGIDVPAVENLIMVRPTKSPTLYQQMRGRGSRLYKKTGKNSFRIYDFAGVTKYFNDSSYDPHVEAAKVKRGVPWGTELSEVEDLTEEQVKKLKEQFIQVPEEAKENVDLVVQRAYVEVGSEGERIDADDYQNAWEREVQELAKAEPLVYKIKNDENLSNEEMMVLADKLNSPKYYFNEANLREAYSYPVGSLSEFIKAALKIKELPTEEQLYENQINELFEAWVVDKNFTAEQVRLLRLVKQQCIVRKSPVDASIFNEPMFRGLGGLNYALSIFDKDQLKSVMNEINNKICVQ